MAGLFALSILLTLPSLSQTAPKDGFVPREPQTLAGIAVLLSKSRDFLDQLRNSGHLDMTPISGIVKVLVTLYNISIKSSGIGTASGGSLRHYLWTLLPPACLVGLSLYLGLCDVELRNIAHAIPAEWLQSSTHTNDVIAAIKRLHGIVRAQTINDGTGSRRRSAELHSFSQRVVQDMISTYALVAILATILILQILAIWKSERDGYRCAAPKAPSSIAAVASLVADSRFFRNLPEDAQWANPEKLEMYFHGQRFRMGWFVRGNQESESRVYAIDAVDHKARENQA
ncbi:hypothetical protein F4810DRAFT_712362 [Camillea tinctor]|nr:hypothetical protein F4810DRAFT_712362 [Camillea tinctor]